MLCQQIKKQIVAYFMGELSEETTRTVREHLNRCASCRAEFESFQHVWHELSQIRETAPSEQMTARFAVLLSGYEFGLHESRHTSPNGWLKTAWAKPALQLGFAVAMLFIGLFIGTIFNFVPTKLHYQQISRELDDMRELVMLSMLKQQSSADRLQAVNYSYEFDQPRDDIHHALQQTLENDPSTNVRLAALRALEPYAHDAAVRRKIVESFDGQRSPLVQIEIIDFIRQTETHAIDLLELLEQDENISEPVRQHIKWTIGTLRGETFIKENSDEKIQY
ncbi:hypothetical protein EH223_06080 [candidate division KSB1 bacterium]|nr:zf-HC2 domain-containing protein [candidate division KSB1 bacterium]RQW05007.1 MAG: hypothetical protein EH223_06080 [candidate division KSB1 bacterium]